MSYSCNQLPVNISMDRLLDVRETLYFVGSVYYTSENSSMPMFFNDNKMSSSESQIQAWNAYIYFLLLLPLKIWWYTHLEFDDDTPLWEHLTKYLQADRIRLVIIRIATDQWGWSLPKGEAVHVGYLPRYETVIRETVFGPHAVSFCNWYYHLRDRFLW